MPEKLKAEKLKKNYKKEVFDFETTEEVESFSEELIGQQRAVKAMELGLKVEQKGYNIFISGLAGTGRKTYAKTLAKKKSEKKPTPSDLCYVYNFENDEEPQVLKLEAGKACMLKEDLIDLIDNLKEEIPEAFVGEEYEKKKSQIMNKYQNKSNQLMEEFRTKAKEKGFILQNTAQGLIPVPINEEGEQIKQEEFEFMDEEKREEIQNKSQEVKSELDKVMRKINQLKTEAQNKLKDLEKKIGLGILQPIITELKEKYESSTTIIDYLEKVQQDIIENLDKFKNKDKDKKKPLIPQMRGDKESFFKRYQINVLVDNSSQEGAPVIYESNPTYYNLFGKIEGKSQFGTITTDFTMIKEGAIHKADGGYLILNAKDLLNKPFAWETLKRALINQKIRVENIGEEYRTIPITNLRPEEIEIDVKVIIVGSPMIYQLLYKYDEEFQKLFKIKADFDVEMERNSENIKQFASFISFISNREEIKDFTAAAVGKIIEYSSRLTGEQNKISTKFNQIMELLFESDAWAEDKEYVEAEDIKKAIKQKEERSNLVEEKIQERISKEKLLVDVKEKEIGQINGLSVYKTGQYSFGRPVRITAQTYLGKEGVINIEREVELSGKIHNKGVMILSGFLGGKYATENPLSLSASLAFEQSYGGIDGDSASCAELLALLSSLAEIPIKQELAITGSMNQKGQVQPIGGVNEKIEGFYKVCKLKGLTGEQGVIIPKQNETNLMLEDEVIEAVEKDQFGVYSVSQIDQAIKLMMDKDPEQVHQQVIDKLAEMANEVYQLKKEK